MGRRLVHLPRLTRMGHPLAAQATALRARHPAAMANRKAAASARHPSNMAVHRPLAAATAHRLDSSPASARRPAAATVNRKAATVDRPRNTARQVVSALRKIRTAAEPWCRWAAVNAAPWARSATRS